MKYMIGIQSFETLRRDGYVYAAKTDLGDKLAQGHTYFLAHPRRLGLLSLYLFILLLFGGCSMIDEDRSDCEKSKIDYELRLITNISTEIKTELETHTALNTETSFELAQLLRDHLSNVFTDFAHDVDLSFYDTVGDSLRLQHDEHFMDANQASYSLNLPMRQYMHLATANILDNPLVTLENDERCHRSELQQLHRDTIDSHETGLFTARLPMEILEGVDQNFNVRLYMANCAAALVIDPRGYDTSDMKVYSTGFATSFSICDSTYQFSDVSPVIRTTRLETKDGEGMLGFCSVNFPSREPETTRTIIDTEEPFIAQPDGHSLWEFHVYMPNPSAARTRADVSWTRTTLRVVDPLRAGQLKIIHVWLKPDGSVVAVEPEVSASVTLDWKPGLEIEY